MSATYEGALSETSAPGMIFPHRGDDLASSLRTTRRGPAANLSGAGAECAEGPRDAVARPLDTRRGPARLLVLQRRQDVEIGN